MQVAAALEVALSSLRIKKGSACRLCLPGHLVLTKRVATPLVAVEKRTAALHFEAVQHIPFALDEVAWGALELGSAGGELDLLLAAARLEALEPLCAAVESAGLIPCACEPAALALWRAIALTQRTGDAADAKSSLFVDVGARSTQVVLFNRETGALGLRTIALGGNSLTAAIAQKLGIDFADAEALKVSGSVFDGGSSAVNGLPGSAAVQNCFAEFSARLAAELTLTQLAYLRQPQAEPPTHIHMCGRGSLLPGLREKVSAALKLPVAEFPIPAALQISPEASMPGAPAAGDLFASYGCAVGAFLPAAQRLDLLPPQRRAQREARRRRPWGLAAAAILALLPAPLLVRQRAAIARAHAQSMAIDTATAPLLRLSASNAAAEARLGELQARLAQVRALDAERTLWLRFLADLQARLTEVGDVWLERLHYAGTADAEAEAELAASGNLGATTAAARVEIGGWLLESRPADEATQRLFDALQSSAFVQRIERERYDRSRPGVIHFDAELLINP